MVVWKERPDQARYGGSCEEEEGERGRGGEEEIGGNKGRILLDRLFSWSTADRSITFVIINWLIDYFSE